MIEAGNSSYPAAEFEKEDMTDLISKTFILGIL